MGQLNLTDRIEGDIRIVKISGELNLYAAPEFRNIIKGKTEEDNIHKCVIDLKDMSYIDSSGIGALITVDKYFKRINSGKEGFMKVVCLGKGPKKVFTCSGLSDYFQIYETEQEAIKDF